jgi:hypothetical protein
LDAVEIVSFGELGEDITKVLPDIAVGAQPNALSAVERSALDVGEDPLALERGVEDGVGIGGACHGGGNLSNEIAVRRRIDCAAGLNVG